MPHDSVSIVVAVLSAARSEPAYGPRQVCGAECGPIPHPAEESKVESMNASETKVMFVAVTITQCRSRAVLAIAGQLIKSIEGYERLIAAGAPQQDAIRWSNRQLGQAFIALSGELPPWQETDCSIPPNQRY